MIVYYVTVPTVPPTIWDLGAPRFYTDKDVLLADFAADAWTAGGVTSVGIDVVEGTVTVAVAGEELVASVQSGDSGQFGALTEVEPGVYVGHGQ